MSSPAKLWTNVIAGALALVVLLPVLHVNNALDIFWIADKKRSATPVLEVKIDDRCDVLSHVVLAIKVGPAGATLTVEAENKESGKACVQEPFAIILLDQLTLRSNEVSEPNRIVGGRFMRDTEGSTSVTLSLAGDRELKAVYEFDSNALKAGFGEIAVQLNGASRNMTDRCSKGPQADCGIPVFASAIYANALYDLGPVLPPTYRLSPGPLVSGPQNESGASYSTTRLDWVGRITTDSGDYTVGTIGVEARFFDKESVAIKQFITVAGSALFGAFISIMCTSLLAFGAIRSSKLCAEEPSAGPSIGPIQMGAARSPLLKAFDAEQLQAERRIAESAAMETSTKGALPLLLVVGALLLVGLRLNDDWTDNR